MNEIAPITRPRAPTIQYEVSDIERMARAIAASKLFGMATPEQAIALCLIAQAEGRHPASAAQDYHIIQGKPSKKADAMLRDFLNSGGKVEWHALDDTTADATFSHSAGGSVRITWDMARAKKAQLNTPMWGKYPRQMLRSRVVSEGVRTVFPMATSGMYVPEEVQEFAPNSEPATAPAVIEHLPGNRARDGSDGQPKSSRQAKLAGDWDGVEAEIAACKTVAELEAWREANDAKIAKMPPKWKLTLSEERYEPRLEELRRAEDSPKVRAMLLAALHLCQSAAEIDEWREQNITAFKSMLKDDQREVVRERDARLAELFGSAVDDDGVVVDMPRNGLPSVMGG